MKLSFNVRGILLAAILLGALGCSEKPREVKKVIPEDTVSARREAAERIAKLYPDAAFGEDLREIVAKATGEDAADEARSRIVWTYGAEELHRRRMEFMVESFALAELLALEELLGKPTGRGVIKGLQRFQDKWRELLEPEILEALSNSP